jgi:hypothetical protein
LFRNPEEKRSPGKPRSRLEGSIQIGLKVCEAKIRLQAVGNKKVKISSSINGVKFLDS